MKSSAVLIALITTAVLQASEPWSITTSSNLGEPAPGVSVFEARCASGEKTARVTAITFNDKVHHLRVIDSPSPGNATLQNTLRAAGALAGVNGNYFQKDFTPVGLVISGNQTVHPFQTAKILSGIAGVTPDGRTRILRSGSYDPHKNIFTQALQCGPVLVEEGKPVAGLDDAKIARRTVIATGPGGNTALIYMSSVTLAEAARILSIHGILDTWTPAIALNLDGGSSSGLWAGDAITLPEISRVRNFLALFAK